MLYVQIILSFPFGVRQLSFIKHNFTLGVVVFSYGGGKIPFRFLFRGVRLNSYFQLVPRLSVSRAVTSPAVYTLVEVIRSNLPFSVVLAFS
jgi:hypothetical protein